MMVLFIVLISLLSNFLAFAVEKPEPFGLKLGNNQTKEGTLDWGLSYEKTTLCNPFLF